MVFNLTRCRAIFRRHGLLGFPLDEFLFLETPQYTSYFSILWRPTFPFWSLFVFSLILTGRVGHSFLPFFWDWKGRFWNRLLPDSWSSDSSSESLFGWRKLLFFPCDTWLGSRTSNIRLHEVTETQHLNATNHEICLFFWVNDELLRLVFFTVSCKATPSSPVSWERANRKAYSK